MLRISDKTGSNKKPFGPAFSINALDEIQALLPVNLQSQH